MDRGRVKIFRPDHPHATKQGYVYRYRLKMEKKLGRYLLPSEIVHHKNGDHSDDRLRNLVVTTQSDHVRIEKPKLHHPNRKYSINRNPKNGQIISTKI